MTLRETLQIPTGLTAIIGGGGKSTLLLRLGRELAAGHKTLLCTSTHMLAPTGVPLAGEPEQAARLLQSAPLVCFGAKGEDGKLSQGAPMEALLSLAEYVLCEADGSKGLPLKAHAPHEPNVPRETKRLVYVAGLDGVGQTVAEAAHRPARYAALLGVGKGHVVTPGDVANAILAEGYGTACAVLLLNKAEGQRLDWGRQAAMLWPGRAVIASLQSAQAIKEVWEDGKIHEK
ncbi:MAG: selenium cofactor biosynthesis protein YqeC [Candidatus Pelethousia sp.]|nr:selenium cofactor biosynthesis protein YqeC [Candidatus Pelethousia sp.]